MTHNIGSIPTNTSERDFLEFMEHGDGFLKIELLRPAKSCYLKALELNMETEKVNQRIEECDRLLAFERKVIRILLAIGIVLALAYLIV